MLSMENQKIYDFIQKILEEWNPIGVPEYIADVEYLDYIPLLIKNAHDEKNLEKQLVAILKYMGFDNSTTQRKKVRQDIKEIARKIWLYVNSEPCSH